MGGISTSNLRFFDNATSSFQGYLSLANNGGFASMRAYYNSSLEGISKIKISVKGDGKRYIFRVRTDEMYWASYGISFQTIKDEYRLGDQILIIGKTGNSVILTVSIIDPTGSVIREFDTFTDRIGTFKVDNFKIPSNGRTGDWIIKIGNNANVVEKSFSVVELTDMVQVNLDKDDRIYRDGDLMAI